ncbi:hypothetical protein CC2G_003672 [Coprinopsis cinerea AmutBmut pab1-1]|nr:hypothetical protein CC2G_003672 [Coprinopsis cinerea AmutBmut pab1-1]
MFALNEARSSVICPHNAPLNKRQSTRSLPSPPSSLSSPTIEEEVNLSSGDFVSLHSSIPTCPSRETIDFHLSLSLHISGDFSLLLCLEGL